MNKERMKLDEAVIATEQNLYAMYETGHKILGRETLSGFKTFTEGEGDEKKTFTKVHVPKKTKRIQVIYLS